MNRSGPKVVFVIVAVGLLALGGLFAGKAWMKGQTPRGTPPATSQGAVVPRTPAE